MKACKTLATVETSFAVIDYLANQRQPVFMISIANGTGINYNTLTNHMATLEKLGIICRENEKWRLGMRLALYWTKVKNQKEAELDEIQNDIDRLNAA
ncbi:hypothetical protein DSCO28_50800 [Desulfosarcina ovata subsp. sediminis]|uniref:HTH iclR-type domain-containing protein n=1 Tax=Desulfosarcina ovata subsp. sediminis TaxID=885957 RepID=A0A5K7ZWF8_9BACT|nr:helix-turn-helix domain-containing protein [Desulfosarcina ovata]BBO84514.1 hypothetical protein DSCO28_50800 [Desulfosarcina ovata subsp. sediminis]